MIMTGVKSHHFTHQCPLVKLYAWCTEQSRDKRPQSCQQVIHVIDEMMNSTSEKKEVGELKKKLKALTKERDFLRKKRTRYRNKIQAVSNATSSIINTINNQLNK